VKALLSALGMGIVALGLDWYVFPTLLREVFSPNSTFFTYRPSGPGVVADMVVSAITTFACSLVAAWVNKPRAYLAAVGVGVLGWLVYYWEVGGISGIRFSEYPLWYELTPTHLVPAWVAGYVASRTRR
jgi:hypothetical protein